MSESTKTKTKAKGKGRKAAASQDGEMSCIDAAAKVLAEKGEPMNCKEMIEAMAAKHLGLLYIPASRGRSATRGRSAFQEGGPW